MNYTFFLWLLFNFTFSLIFLSVTTDSFWDVVFVQAEQAADDLGIDLRLDRLEPQPTTEIWHAKMASKMISLCQEGVDGLFITIPGASVVKAIQECEALNVPVMSINAGAATAKEIGLIHHISQLEYAAGFAAGKRLIEGGMKEAMCLIYEEGNVANQERCQGLIDAVAKSPDATYLETVIVDRDSDAATVKAIEDTVGRDGEWDGVGILNNGPDTAGVIVKLQDIHPKILAGTFDLSDTIYNGLDEEVFLFAIDQNPFVQGYMPIWLLTLLASTKQHLANTFIESGPRFVEKSPSKALQQCTENHFEVCPRPLDIVYYDNLLDSGILAFGYVAVAISWALSLFFLGWIVKNRKLDVVQASQPDFLALICGGAVISSSTLVALSFQAGTNEDTTKASTGCTVAPFLYTIGWVLIFSSLCAKTFRMFKIRKNLAENRQEVVSFASMLKIVVFALVADMLVVVTWTVANPLVVSAWVLCMCVKRLG
jgi:simple sugar transport system substrate-binding protein